jgi:hypothetical protein
VYLTSVLNPVKNMKKGVFNTLYDVTFAVQETHYANNTHYKGAKHFFLLFIIVEVRSDFREWRQPYSTYGCLKWNIREYHNTIKCFLMFIFIDGLFVTFTAPQKGAMICG